jgi:hypothetical protein
MTNYIEPAKELLHAKDNKTLNVLGVLQNVTKGLWRLYLAVLDFSAYQQSS